MISVDFESIYESWRGYLLANSDAEHFGVIFDPSKQAKFPYANLMMVGHPTNGSNLGADEMSVNLTFDAEGYINNSKTMTLYNIDDANADFFLSLGFRRVGDSQIARVSNTVTKITSRFTLTNFTGTFLTDLPVFETPSPSSGESQG